jgi:hypothetical protein
MIKVEWGLEGETNVDQVVDKTNKGLNGIEKNAKRVNDAFTMSASSFFLKFLGPMALLQMAISAISDSMEKAKQTAEAGFNTLASGEDKYASEQESRMAAFFKQREDEAKAMQESEAGRKASTEKFFEDRGFWKSVFEAPVSTFAVLMGEFGIGSGAGAKWIQKGASEDWAKAQKAEGKKMENGGATGTTFKGPEGFSNVVGVGANPVMEKMTRQNEIMEEIKIILQEQFILNRNGSVPAPFTERVPLTMQKAGLS